MRRQVVYSARWYNTPPLGPAVDFVRSGGFRSNQLEAPGWLALYGLGGVIGLAIHFLASADLLASLAGGVGLVWIGAIIADRLHGRRLRDGSRAG
jgi:hypothetical protein